SRASGTVVLPRVRSDSARLSWQRRGRRADRCVVRLGGGGWLQLNGHGLARHQSAGVSLLAAARFSNDVPAPVSAHPVRRVPILAGSRLVVVTADDDALVLQPPPPAGGVADV